MNNSQHPQNEQEPHLEDVSYEKHHSIQMAKIGLVMQALSETADH